MTEEWNHFCTDLKELFMQQDFERMEQELAGCEEEMVLEIMKSQHDIVSGYYSQGKYEILLSHLNFVAFCSYLFEYTAKKGMITQEQYEEGIAIYLGIFTLAKNQRG